MGNKSLPEVIRPLSNSDFKLSHELNAPYEDTLFLTLSLEFFMLM